MKKKALVTASVASMIDLFNADNIRILQQMGYEVHVAANFAFGSITSQERVHVFREELRRAGVTVWHVPIPRRISDVKHILKSFRKMRWLCRRESYQIIHTQSPIGGVVTRCAALGTGGRIIYTAHGFHFFSGAPVKNWLLFYPIEKLLSRKTDTLLTMNREDYARAKKFHAKNVFCLPGIGVDVQAFAQCDSERGRMRSSLGIMEQDFVLISVGQLSVRKNQETMLRAMARIQDARLKYLLVGFGEREEADRKLVKELGLDGRVLFAGYRSDVRELLHAADCFVFPSLQEGLPVALMEAMAAGLPVICSRIRGNADLVTDGVEGRLVDPLDVSGYEKAVREFMRNPKFAEACKKNAWKKIQQFDAGRVQKRMQAIYANRVEDE